MTPGRKKWIGLALITSGILWSGGTQLLITSVPYAAASEAPDRHFPGKTTFNKTEAYHLAFATAKDVGDGIPNVLIPAVLLLIGSWLFHGARRQPNEMPRS